MNNVRTLVLMAGLMALFLVLGQMVAGTGGLVFALVAGSAMNFAMYFYSDKMVLRMYRAKVVTAAEAPQLYAMVDRLRQQAGLPMPVVAVAPHDQPNAFATGRNPEHAVVAVTTGILKYMPPDELEAVLAHELGHIKNRDMLITTIAAGIAGAIGFLPYLLFFLGGRGDGEGRNPYVGLAMIILAPIAAGLIQMAVSRQREFEADRTAARILGTPDPMIRSLRRLESMSRQIPMDVAPAAAPLAQVNPLAAHGGGVAGLFSTHPPTADRIAALEALDRGV